jgi:hypothetical protein
MPVLTLGWREWVALPGLNIPAIKAKLDTGARTSALHAYRVEPFTRHGVELVRFWLHPLRRDLGIERRCETPVLDRRVVRDSGGHTDLRYVIATQVCIGNRQWDIEITLTNRENMLFRMLLGRTAMAAGAITVDPSISYVFGNTAGRVYREKPGG